ncbi:MAG: TlpA family protein disulfide reductase [bacterium]|nr:TlpA family protein disulfide reductase [bacterium]
MDEGRRGRLRTIVWIGLLGLALLVWFNYTKRIRLIRVDRAATASELTLRRVDGTRLDLESLRGSVVLLNAWASWCGPCRAEIPALSAVDAELRDDGLAVPGLNLEDLQPRALGELAGQLGVTYDVVQAASPLRGTFESPGTIPHTWLIDRRGRVRASHVGLVEQGSLMRACRTLLEE